MESSFSTLLDDEEEYEAFEEDELLEGDEELLEVDESLLVANLGLSQEVRGAHSARAHASVCSTRIHASGRLLACAHTGWLCVWCRSVHSSSDSAFDAAAYAAAPNAEPACVCACTACMP